jgi:hypothetical protein
MKFPKEWEGMTINLIRSGDYYEAPMYQVCCDCGLTHKFSYRGKFVKSNEVKLYIKSERKEEKTKYVRDIRGLRITAKHPSSAIVKARDRNVVMRRSGGIFQKIVDSITPTSEGLSDA